MRLWFDPRADIVKHDPPRKPLDPSRPIKRVAALSEAASAYAKVEPHFVASESDPA